MILIRGRGLIELFALFNKDTIDKGKSINNEIQIIYDKIQRITKIPDLNMQGFSIYYLYPFFFKDDFLGVSDYEFEVLSKASALYSDVILFYDKCQDNGKCVDINILLHKNLITKEAIKLLCELFTSNSEFWDFFDRYISQYIQAINLENQKHRGVITPYTYDEFKRIAQGKSAIAKTAVAGLGCLNGDIYKINELEETQDIFAEAAQLFDDLRDWKEDLKIKQYTWLLTDIILNHNLDNNICEETISDILFSYRYDEIILEKISALCELAMLKAGATESWVRRIKVFQARVDKLLFDLANMKGTKVILHNAKSNERSSLYKEEVIDTVKFILEQTEKGYPELKHWMVFPNSQGFSCKEQCQGGDIFQRGFILNLIMDMKRFGVEIDSETIDKEIDYLVGMKSPFFEVGWSYYPDLPELSPDIDTLSEMIKIWVSTKENKKLKEYIDATIKFIMEKCKNEGPFSTWIIDENDERDINVRALKAAKEMWGDEPDPEVNANFLYALSILNFDKYKPIIERGVNWILEMQKEEGYWESTWYVGNYYGSYICSKLFKQLNIYNVKIEKMIKHLKESQNSNGSWGEGNGNVLDTSYALSALIDIGESQKVKDIIERGISYLLNSKNEFGFWNGCDFIKMNMDRVAGNTRIVTYKSAILTSAICTSIIVKKCNN